MEFTATQHDAGSIYIVRQAQGYPDYQYEYISASSARVRIGHNFPGEYSIVCVKKPAGGGSSSNGGGSSSDGGGRSSGGGSSSTGRSSAKNSPNQTVKQGWILENNIWYYYSGTTRSTLKKGWHLDSQDGFWYYLDLNTGAMFTDWHYINGEWYYFNPYTPMWTWEQHSDGEWYYKGIEKSRPLGSMYAGEKTPDGYMVDSEGHWVH